MPKRRSHARQPSNPIPTSDYDSDFHAHPYTPHNPHTTPRTNTELNLSVLRRYLPTITTILSVAANAVIYTFDSAARTWDKSGVEGTLFVCARESPSPSEPRYCVFVLNRRGLENLVLGLETVKDVEVTDDLLIMALEGGEEEGGEAKAMGVWMHADGEDTRKLNMNIIHGLWEQVRDARRAVGGEGETYGAGAGEETVGPAVQAIGRTLSIDELFASQAGGGFGR